MNECSNDMVCTTEKNSTEESDLYKCQPESLEMNQDVDQELTTLKVRSAITHN